MLATWFGSLVCSRLEISVRLRQRRLEKRSGAHAVPGLARLVGGFDESLYRETVVHRDVWSLRTVDRGCEPAEVDRTTIGHRQLAECLPATRPQTLQRTNRVHERVRFDCNLAVRSPEAEFGADSAPRRAEEASSETTAPLAQRAVTETASSTSAGCSPVWVLAETRSISTPVRCRMRSM